MTILSYITIFGPIFSAILENLWEQFFRNVPKTVRFWPKIIWHQKRIFSGKMTILSYKTIFGPTFSAILENLLELFFRKVPKTAILGKNDHFS